MDKKQLYKEEMDNNTNAFLQLKKTTQKCIRYLVLEEFPFGLRKANVIVII